MRRVGAGDGRGWTVEPGVEVRSGCAVEAGGRATRRLVVLRAVTGNSKGGQSRYVRVRVCMPCVSAGCRVSCLCWQAVYVMPAALHGPCLSLPAADLTTHFDR